MVDKLHLNIYSFMVSVKVVQYVIQACSLEHLPILGIEPAGDVGHTAGSGLSTF